MTIELDPVALRASWGPGPWQSEPDRVEFRHAGLPCLLVRNMSLGTWCGYVAVPPGHPLHGLSYDDVPTPRGAHGGLTYSSVCAGDICHVPAPGEPDDVWWFGFDCAHGGDYMPYVASRSSLISDIGRDWIYRDQQYVTRCCVRIANQFANLARRAATP